jgi:hypothetical protein
VERAGKEAAWVLGNENDCGQLSAPKWLVRAGIS